MTDLCGVANVTAVEIANLIEREESVMLGPVIIREIAVLIDAAICQSESEGGIMTKTISGTKEWAVANVNCVRGCSHRCRYCYARHNALRFRRIKSPEEWGTTYNTLRVEEVTQRRRKVNGTVLFPSTHDITPEFLGPCLDVIANILLAGNRLLIVSKPHLECIEAICRRFHSYRDKILFRFTIGAFSDQILGYWEPGAPAFSERVASLAYAHRRGFATSVSCEPLLGGENVECLVAGLSPFVTDSIWIGKMNHIKSRVIPGTDPAEIARIEAGQTDERVREICESLKGNRKVRWKESYKRTVGLKLAEQPGMDT